MITITAAAPKALRRQIPGGEKPMLIKQEPRKAKIGNGTYPAVFTDIEDLGIEPTVRTQDGKKLVKNIHFLRGHFLLDVDGRKEEATKKVSWSTDERSNLYKWNRIFTGNGATQFETADWEGKSCRVEIIVNTDDKENEWDNIKDVLPPAQSTFDGDLA